MRTPSGVATFDPALAGSTLADLAAHGAISTDGDAGRTGAAYRMNTWILPAFGMAFCLLFIPITFYVDTTISFEGDMTLANIIGPFLALCAFICGVGLFRGLLWPPRIELHENELRVRMTAANAGRDTVIAFREINAIHNRSGRFGPIAYGLIDIVGGGKSTQLFTSHNAAVKLNDILYARAVRI